MAMRKALGSPLRVFREGGLVYFMMTAYELDGKHYPGFEVGHYNYEKAKAMFWDEWRDRNPGVWLEFRLPKGFM